MELAAKALLLNQCQCIILVVDIFLVIAHILVAIKSLIIINNLLVYYDLPAVQKYTRCFVIAAILKAPSFIRFVSMKMALLRYVLVLIEVNTTHGKVVLTRVVFFRYFV